jgi:hypothetical protein
MKWEALLILQSVITKATASCLHFWLSMAATTFTVATLMSIPSERTHERLSMPSVSALVGKSTTFGNVLLSRVCAV